VLSWKLKATTFSRFYFQLAVSMPSTAATAFGLWPTPTTDAANGNRSKPYAQGGMPLTLAVHLLPTPTCNDAKNAIPSACQAKRNAPGLAIMAPLLLPTPVAGSALLPTPQANDAKHNRPAPSELAKPRTHPMLHTTLGGSLNPRFVAQMMGFPADWCELPAPALNS